MKLKYRKFDSYIRSWYGGFKVSYLPIRTWEANRLIDSQTTEKHSDRMKELREKRKDHKHWRNVHHYLKQHDQRVLRETKKLWS